MDSAAFREQLVRFGPEASAPVPSPAEAERYCRALAETHYENFTVASRLLPRRLRQHFANVYAYCRWSDDLADETLDAAESLRLLDWWEGQLHACFRGEARHPVFVALADTIRQFQLPHEPFAELLVAFRQDQRVRRYETEEQLLAYCRYSANPVGRIVLRLGRCYDDALAERSDAICTGLQLANFWQDVARDFDRGRVYIPAQYMQRFACTEEMLAARRATPQFRRMLAALVDRAAAWFDAGEPLVARVSRALRLPVALFLGGGRAILRAIRRADYDVLSRRPRLGTGGKLWVFAQSWWKARTLRCTEGRR